jgi:hypothetical protein
MSIELTGTPGVCQPIHQLPCRLCNRLEISTSSLGATPRGDRICKKIRPADEITSFRERLDRRRRKGSGLFDEGYKTLSAPHTNRLEFLGFVSLGQRLTCLLPCTPSLCEACSLLWTRRSVLLLAHSGHQPDMKGQRDF